MLVQKALESEYTADGYGHGEKKEIIAEYSIIVASRRRRAS